MNHKTRSTLGHLLLHIVLLSLGVIFLLPFVWSVSTSLKPMSDLFQVTPNLIPSEIRWQNYQDVLDYVPFVRIYANTIIVTVLRVIGQVFLASLAAFAFSRMQFPGRDLLFFLLLAGLMVPQQVLMIPNYAMMRQVGWLDTYQGLVVPLLFSSFGVFLLRQYFLSIPADFQDAATLEGANPFHISSPIHLPLARPALAAFAFLVIQWSWNEFLWALIMTSRTEMQVLSVGVALFQGQYFTNNALLMAAANMATIPVLLLFLFFQRQLVEGITLSGLK